MKAAPTLGLLVLSAGCAAETVPPAPPPPPPPLASAAPVASAPPPIRETPDAPFRQHPPLPGPPITFVPPKVDTFALKNGIRVFFVERHDPSIVAVRVVTKGGAGDLPWEPPGAVAMAGSMMELGTDKRNALQVSDAYEALGAEHGSWTDWDAAGAYVKVTADRLDAALPILADVALHPTLPAEELERLRARRLAGNQQEKASPRAMASNATAAALFGRAHPYGHAMFGEAADIEKVTRADVVAAHDALFRPDHIAIVVAGAVTRADLEKKLGETFGGWTAPPAGGRGVVRPHAAHVEKDAARIVLVDEPGAPQSVVRLAEPGIAADAPDRDAVRVMNAVFGGMFSSRINLNLREAHAYTYGAFSFFDMRHGAGAFIAGASVKADTTAASISELFKEERAMVERPVSPEELAGAKDSILEAMPARFETVDAVTEAVADLFIYDRPADYFATLQTRIGKVTAEDVQKAAKAHLHPRTTRVVIVGDASHVVPTLEPLHLGGIEMRDAYGDPVPAASAKDAQNKKP